MQSNFTLHFAFTSTGIMVEARQGGRCVAWREIGKAKMQHWVSEHADRQAAIEFDPCITAAIERDEKDHARENPHGSLAGLFSQCAFINRLAAGLEDFAS